MSFSTSREFNMSKCLSGRWAIVVLIAAGMIAGNSAFAAEPKKAAPKISDEKMVRDILDQEVAVELDGQSVKEICLYLGETYGLAVRIDSTSVKRLRPESASQLVNDGPQANEIRNLYAVKLDIPISRGMTVADALTEICTQMPGKWSYRVRNTSVLIGPAFEPPFTPGSNVHGDMATMIPMERILEQLLGESVSFSVTETPLAEALQELRKRTGANIVLDKKIAEQAEAKISGTFNDARLLTVLQLLTDMAGLKVVSMNNVFYITDGESADKLQSDHNRELFGEAMPPTPPAPCAGIFETRVSNRR